MKYYTIEELENYFKVPFHKEDNFKLYFKNDMIFIQLKVFAYISDALNQEKYYILKDDLK